MRILLVSHYFLPRHRAGVENYTYRLALALGVRHEVVVFCREDGFWDEPLHEEEDAYGGVRVHRVYYNGRLDFRACYRNAELDALFRSYVLRWKPDVVHFQHLERLSVGFIDVVESLGIPSVLTLNDFWFACPQIQLLRGDRICAGPDEGRACATCPGLLPESLRLQALAGLRQQWDASPVRRALRVVATRVAPRALQNSVRRALFQRSIRRLGVDVVATQGRHADLRQALDRIDLVLSPSRFLLRKLRDFGFAHGAAEYSDYGVPAFGSAAPRRLPSPRTRFGYFSAVVPHKGIELLLRAFRRLRAPGAELIVQGLAPLHYEREARRLASDDPRISFRPPYDDEGIAMAFSSIDVLVVPSLWYENSPLVIHEAARAGVPVIAADVGGMAEYVRPGANGVLFRCGDERDLARALRLFVDDPALAERLRQVPFVLKSMADDAAGLELHYARLANARGESSGPP